MGLWEGGKSFAQSRDGVNIEIDQDSMNSVLDAMDPKQAQKTHALTLNKLLTIAKRLTLDQFAEDHYINKKGILIHSKRASNTRLSASLWGRKTPYSLSRFRIKQEGSGVLVQFGPGNSAMIDDAFIKQPSGRDWSKRGQIKTRTSPIHIVLRRITRKPYKLLGDTSLVDKDRRISLGEFVVSKSNRDAISKMIEREGPAILKQTIADQVKRRAKKMGIDVDAS